MSSTILGAFRVKVKHGHIYLKKEGQAFKELDVLVRRDLGEVWVSDLLTPRDQALAVDMEMRAMGYVPLLDTR